MPDDMANEVSEELNKKRITPEEMLQDALSDIARDIAIIEPNPVDWGWWVSYFLEQLEIEAKKGGRDVGFTQMMNEIIDL